MSYLFTVPRDLTLLDKLKFKQSGGIYTITPANPSANRTLNLIDPGGTDDFLFAAAAQTITNKTLGGNLAAGGFKVTGLADPTSAQEAATKAYVDSVAQGLNPKPSCRLATIEALPANTYANGTSGVGATLTADLPGVLEVDDVEVALNDYILVQDEADPENNGIYKCTTAGEVAVAFILTRALEMNQAVEFAGSYTFVTEGTVNADKGFVCTTDNPVTVGTTEIDFTQFSGAASITAGDGLTMSGSTINAVGTSNRISVSADAIDISTSYVGQASITTLGTIGTGVWEGTAIGDTYIATSYIKADGTRALTGNWAAGSFSGTFNNVTVGQAANQLNNADNASVNGTDVSAFTIRGGNKTGGSGTSGAGASVSLLAGSATGSSSTGNGGSLLLAGGSSVGGTAGSVNIGDAADNTKLLGFTLSGATTAKKMTLLSSHTDNRTLTLPNLTDTLVSRTSTDTLTNKTLTSPVINHAQHTVSSADYSVQVTDETILVTTGSSDRTITLPASSSAGAGKRFTVKKVDSGSGNVIVSRTGSDTLDGATTQTIYQQYDQLGFEADGTNYHVG